MAKSKEKYQVEYHPEFLYFNKFVRDNGYNPEKDRWVWEPEHEGGLSPFHLCNALLFDLAATSHKPRTPWSSAVENILKETCIFKDFPKGVDAAAWIKYAKSLDIEGMLDRYLPRIFNAFGEPFSVPAVKISPFRLTSCPSNHFNAILSGSFTPYSATNGDPAFYDPVSHIIYLPVPERETKLPPAFLDWILLHELFHSVVRPFLARSFGIGAFQINLPENIVNRAFGEIFSEVGAYSILEMSGEAPKRLKGPILRAQVHGHKLYMESFVAMKLLGLPYLASLLKPVFSVSRDLEFLSKEWFKVQRLTEKQARGILTKKYNYKKRVKGMDKKALKARLEKHEETRIRAMVDEIGSLDIHRLLRSAVARDRNPSRKKLLTQLCDLFDPKQEEEWVYSGIFGVARR